MTRLSCLEPDAREAREPEEGETKCETEERMSHNSYHTSYGEEQDTRYGHQGEFTESQSRTDETRQDEEQEYQESDHLILV